MSRSALAERHPWTLPWWKADGENFFVMVYIVSIHVLAVVGIILFPLPGWRVFLGALIMACAGGLGTDTDFLCLFQWIRLTEHLDRKSPQPPREFRHRGRRVEPSSWRVLVGAPSLALPMGTVQHEKVVPRYDATALHPLGEIANTSRRGFTLLRLLPFWLGRILLAWRHSNALLPAHAVLCEQPAPSQTRTA